MKGEIGLIGKEIISLKTATSTNDYAAELSRQRDDTDGLVVLADSQSRGKGRLGRAWISPPGVNLYFTVILKPPFPPSEASLLTLAAAVATITAVRENTGLNAEVKWPNDILIDGRKAGGILLEMKTERNRIKILTVGIGLNVNMSLHEFPEDLRSSATSLKLIRGEDVDRMGLLGTILGELEKTYKIILSGNKRALINKWIRLNCTLGHEITVRNRDRVISGIAEDVNEMGGLIIRTPGGNIETLNAGEVTIVKNKPLNPFICSY
ncbi:MAG: biotin--[acetyl-CoA-carboxylase] ligase [Nitrospirae bacterium]|nr:biotin--[acetyl-CoA-carboxylase] ligase [Nitrospirota bacterium]